MFEMAAIAIVTLFVTIGPIENAAIFGLLTQGARRVRRGEFARRGIVIGGSVLIVFAMIGQGLLDLLNISLPAFRFAGGLLLLLQAINLVLVHPTGLSSITMSEEREAENSGDISVFPLAIPLIAGPGSMTAIILLFGQADSDYGKVAVIFLALILVLAMSFAAFLMVERLQALLGVTGTNVVARVSGILLAALASQFMFDGIRAAHLFT